MTTQNTFRSQLLRDLFAAEETNRAFQGIYHVSTVSDDKPLPLLDAIGVHKDSLSDTAKRALEAIEELEEYADNSPWSDFRWKLSAFLHLQDIFDLQLQPSTDELVLFQQYYFYYESRLILAESILAGLNGLYAASSSLLRPFLEFTLLQHYYYRVVRSSKDYGVLCRYFKDGKHPSWGSIFSKALPTDPFCKRVRKRIQAHLSALSHSASHPYHPDHSPLQHRASAHGHSLIGLHFWVTTSMILDAALWTYYANFPLLFYPVDVVRYFGFNGPVGIVADLAATRLVRRSLSQADYDAFKAYSENHADTLSTVEWLKGFPELSDEEIARTWNTSKHGNFPGLVAGWAAHMASFRALRTAIAFRASKPQDIPDALIDKLQRLDGWK